MSANREKIAVISSIMRKRKAEKNILFFAEYYLASYHPKRFKTPEFHKEILRLVRNEKRLAIAAPRGFAKSTLVNIIYTLHCMLYGRNEDILTISQSGSLANEWIRKIKIILETNERIRKDFMIDMLWGENKSKKWTEDHLTLDDGEGRIVNQVRAKGRGYQIRGFRPTKIVCDDLEDDELVRSSEQRKKLKDWFKGALMSTIDTEQQLFVIGTILHPLALLNEITSKKEDFALWETRKFKALIKDKSIWEQKWPTKMLEAKKKEIGTYAFEAEYMNNPIPSESVLFKPDQIQKYEEEPKTTMRVTFLDPAGTDREKGDEHGLVTIGITKNGDIYELESKSGRWGLDRLCEEVLATYERWKVGMIGIEKVAFQGIIKRILIKAAQDKGILGLPVRQITVGAFSSKERREPKDKWSRAFKVTPLFEQGKVFLKSRKLIEQLLLFPTGDADDLLDAFVYATLMIKDYYRKGMVLKIKEQANEGNFDPKDPYLSLIHI